MAGLHPSVIGVASGAAKGSAESELEAQLRVLGPEDEGWDGCS